jgi:hypothetical protein
MAPPNINLASTLENCGTNSLKNSVALASIVADNDADHFNIPRSELFKNDLCIQDGDGLFPPGQNGVGNAWTNCNNPKQVNYITPTSTTHPSYMDAVCESYNDKYPWIESVRRWQHTDYRCYMDAAWIRIPARNGPGRYQIHYLWSSYRDTIDVDVQPASNPVDKLEVYGNVTATPVYAIADHCMFEDAKGGWNDHLGQCNAIVTTPQQCEQRCNRVGGACVGFAVMPLNGPKPFTTETQIPWDTDYCQKSYITKNIPPNTNAMICYTVGGFRDDMNGASPPWTMYTDPRDVGFYSTCYVKKKPNYFHYPINPPVLLDDNVRRYRFGDQCLPCQDRSLKSTVANPVDWRLGECVDCDKYPQSVPRVVAPAVAPAWQSEVPPPAGVGTGFFKTNSSCSKCVKWIAAPGAEFAFDDECRLLTSMDPECTEFVAFSASRAQAEIDYGFWSYFNASLPLDYDNGFSNCACWKKSCCGAVPTVGSPSGYFTKSPYVAGNFKVHKITKTVA